MKLNLIGREIEIKWIHLVSALIAIFVVIIPLTLLLNSGYQNLYRLILLLVGIIANPLSAFIFLVIAGFFKLPKNSKTFLSLSVSFFLIFFIITILADAWTNYNLHWLNQFDLLYLLGLASSIIGRLTQAILVYLWMPILDSIDMKKAKRVAILALVFSFCLFLCARFVDFFVSTVGGGTYQFFFDWSMLQSAATDFILGFAILYSVIGKKLDKIAAYLFSAGYLGSVIFYFLATFYIELTIPTGILAQFVLRCAVLGLLYLIWSAELKGDALSFFRA